MEQTNDGNVELTGREYESALRAALYHPGMDEKTATGLAEAIAGSRAECFVAPLRRLILSTAMRMQKGANLTGAEDVA